MNVRGITEGALFAALTIILSLLGYYVPFLTVIIYIILPIPTILMYKRFGLVYAFLEAVTASLLLFLFIDPINTIIIACNIAVPGILLGYSYYAKKSGGIRVLFGYFGSLVALIVEIVLSQVVMGVPFVEEFTNEINTMTQTVLDTYQNAGLLQGDNATTLVNSVNQVKDMLLMLLPTIFLTLPLMVSYCTVLFTDLLFHRLGIKYQPIKPLTEWQLPDSAKNFIAITTLIIFLLNYFLQDSPYYIYTYTIELIIMGLFTLMGFSFIFWYLNVKFKRKLVFVRVLIVLLCLLVSWLLTLVSLIGIFDTYFGIRKFVLNRIKKE